MYIISLFAGEQFVIESDGLLVRNVRRTDAGTYTCRARFVNSYKYLKRIHKKDQFKVKMLRQGSPDRRIGGEGHQTGRAGGTSNSRWSLFGTNRIFLLFDKQIQDDHQMQCIVLKMEMEIYPLKTLRKCLRWKKKMWRHFECAGAAKLGFATIRPQRR